MMRWTKARAFLPRAFSVERTLRLETSLAEERWVSPLLSHHVEMAVIL